MLILVAIAADKASVGQRAAGIEAHPERRFKAALEKYIEEEMPVIRKDVRSKSQAASSVRPPSLTIASPILAPWPAARPVPREALPVVQEAQGQPVQRCALFFGCIERSQG